MGSRIQCFLLEPSGILSESLRRYASGSTCALHSYHDAEVVIGAPLRTEDVIERRDDDLDHKDPRWPAACECGYAFKPEDTWQHNLTQKWRRVGTEDLYVLGSAPVGAMWFAPWLSSMSTRPDKQMLVVRTPAGEWMIDSKASNGPGWTRTGEPPVVTARPSIGIGEGPGGFRYHAFLTDGGLVEV